MTKSEESVSEFELLRSERRLQTCCWLGFATDVKQKLCSLAHDTLASRPFLCFSRDNIGSHDFRNTGILLDRATKRPCSLSYGLVC